MQLLCTAVHVSVVLCVSGGGQQDVMVFLSLLHVCVYFSKLLNLGFRLEDLRMCFA